MCYPVDNFIVHLLITLLITVWINNEKGRGGNKKSAQEWKPPKRYFLL